MYVDGLNRVVIYLTTGWISALYLISVTGLIYKYMVNSVAT